MSYYFSAKSLNASNTTPTAQLIKNWAPIGDDVVIVGTKLGSGQGGLVGLFPVPGNGHGLSVAIQSWIDTRIWGRVVAPQPSNVATPASFRGYLSITAQDASGGGSMMISAYGLTVEPPPRPGAPPVPRRP